MKNYIYTLILLVTILSSGCLKKQDLEVKELAKAPSHIVELNESEQFILSDLPIPMGFHLVAYQPDSPIIYSCYQGSLPLKKIKTFLQHDAERNGWRFDNLATPQIKTYLIAKPGKVAMIMLERKRQQSLIHINLKIQAS